MVRDFIGQPIIEGSWLACGAKGNESCEYGMVLYKVLAVVEDKLKLMRLKVRYPDHKTALARVAKATTSNPNKYVVVNPPPKMVRLFERVKTNTASQKDFDQCGIWLHGQKKDIWT